MSDSYYEHLFGVRDKVVLITGGTRGIGLMIAEGMVRCGANVYIASRKKDACRAAEDDLGQHGKCTAIPSDISSIDGCQTLADEIATREGRLDVLINNAGVTWSEDIDKFSEKAWDKVVDLDAKSPFFLTQRLLPQLRIAASPESRAVVINVSSVNGIRPSSLRNYSYVVAKAGLQQLSVQLAQDLNADNINVNCIAPGPFKSKMTAPLYSSDEVEQQVMQGFTMGRWGATEDAAGLSIFLASKAGSFLTGLLVPFDGGATAIGSPK
jgi:NAD(P)-dependent dehydrogenase (short-subunit alcohol dehydrogenase family)